VSIEFNGRVGEKPPRWEYMDDYRRRNLYYVYSSLIDLKKNEDAFSTTNYTLDLYNALKKIKLTADDMSVVVLGNFDIVEGDINPDFQSTGTWYNYWTSDSIVVTDVNETINLKAGEYRLYTSKRLTKPEYVGISDVEKAQNTNVLYPNPVINNLTITNTEDIKQINIYNMLGKIVYSESYNNNKAIVINTNYLNSGYYIAKLESKNGYLISKKIIKK
jgi:hypothetical protein